MSYKIQEIQGIGPSSGEKLSAVKIATTDDLLDACSSGTGRKALAEKTGLSESQLLKWTNLADLMRISGVGPQFSELLEGAGVDTIKELRHRNPENLATAMKQLNEQKNLAKTSPAASVVARWVQSAKETMPKITH